ncbi:hypothetical protein ACVXHB_10775 [Escherichia coli]
MEAIWKIEVEDFRRLSWSMTKVTTSSSKSSTNSARTALKNLFGPAPGSMLPGDPLGHLFAIVISRLLVNSQYFP